MGFLSVHYADSLSLSVNTDPIGVELAGALKNVYAIASGVSGGLGFEANTRAGEPCFLSLLLSASLISACRRRSRHSQPRRDDSYRRRLQCGSSHVRYNISPSLLLASADFGPCSFLSLAGVGDLFLTCSSEKSRNFTVGYRLGQGETLEHILDTLGSVAEGVDTAKSFVPFALSRLVSS